MTYALPDPDRHSQFYAGVPARRALAWVIDVGLSVVMTAVVLPFTGFLALFVLVPFYALVSFLVRWISLSAWSATPGMALCGIQVRRFDGGRMDGGTAFLHTLGFHLSWLIFPLQLISVAFMAMGPRGQGLSDLALGTAVIRRPAD